MGEIEGLGIGGDGSLGGSLAEGDVFVGAV